MSGETEIKGKLVLDDAASATVEKVKVGFGSLNTVVKDVSDSIGSGLKHALSTAAGVQISGIIDTFKDIGKNSIEEALGGAAETKALQAVMALTDQTGAEFKDLGEKAKEYDGLLEDLGIKAGQSGKALKEAFGDIAERSKLDADGVLNLVEMIAYAGKAVPGGTEALTRGFADMEAGIIRAKNPLVQLIASQHLMKGNAKEISKELSKLNETDPGKVMSIAESAVNRMSKQMKDLPLGWNSISTVLKDMRGEVFEAIGTPIVKAVVPQLEKFRQYWIAHKDQIEKFVATAGNRVAELIAQAGQSFEEGFSYIHDNFDKISDDIKEGWKYAKEVVDFILAHRKEIATAIAVNAVANAAPAIGGVASIAGNAAKSAFSAAQFIGSQDIGALTGGITELGLGAKKSAGVMKEMLEGWLWPMTTKMSSEAMAMSKALGSAAKGLGAVSLAAGALYLAYDQWEELQKRSDSNSNSLIWTKLKHDVGSLTGGRIGTTDKEYEAETNKRQGIIKGDDYKKMQADDLAKYYEAVEKISFYTKKAVDEAAETHNESAWDLITAYNMAAELGDAATQKYVADMLINSKYNAEALVKMGATINGGLKGMEELLKDGGDGVLAQLKKFEGKLGGWEGKKSDTKQAAPVYSFPGATFNIKQDFRDQDPDRLMVTFKDDILRNADARRASRMGTPFGL